MKHKAMATITLPVVAVFEDDGVHDLDEQAIDALQAEAQCTYCLHSYEFELDGIEHKQIN